MVEGVISPEMADEVLSELRPHLEQRRTYSEGGVVGIPGEHLVQLTTAALRPDPLRCYKLRRRVPTPRWMGAGPLAPVRSD